MNIASVRRPIVPPTPPRAPDDMSFLGRVAVIRQNMIATWGQRAYEEDVLEGRFFLHKSFILNRPDAIRHVLLSNYENYTRTPAGIRMLRPVLGEGLLIAEGHAWTFQRRTLAPAFTPRATANLVPHMTAVLDETIAKLDARSGETVDLRETMQRMTLEIAGRTMFSFGMDRHGPTLRNFVVEYGERLGRPYFLDMLLPVSWPSPMDFARARFRKRWTEFVAMLIAERRAAGKKDGAPPRDLFDLMDEARDPETGKGFSDEQLIDEVATMILAGHETTATALFWALYLLALDPDTQEEVASETRGEHLDSMADIDRQKFTRAVIEETMRLYPPAFLIARAARAKDNAAGIEIGRGDIIMIAPWLLHRHEKLWDQPNAFVPKRFMSTEAPDRFAYLPFGAGPRVCVGAPFAQAESVLALARLIGAFRVELVDTVPVIPHGVVTTQPDRSPMFRITRR
ncbi:MULTISPECIES: cytochrome P450 [Bradyrhizobium]|uniref:Bll0557 protein n=1 Tax=Bradyrhizobium diazoefficiens (strain JCM 10833 / BCRC 13528 / IAM 13628 / NBRC 14792 / USDA 110) TaxID=224911 RepID=Q89WX1_BRADU|nr:cytochrome P450 [Bradyrhizobium diazoefficiens]MBP1060772.1 cytochrome P450 [Bradyrhizobium japonicum]AND93619.1 cytochrome P450 [Bradyrhizobium diazoefficiens USDA 110]PDT62587.1 cytochrome P450 [Bradyrhizobium diazoefficiens]QBP19517.1 cytochrome P450 [Bradyrhizobium diazoefficiens]QJS40783.1 cytochrome P450 [Bradyrhizobium diazoefficiens]